MSASRNTAFLVPLLKQMAAVVDQHMQTCSWGPWQAPDDLDLDNLRRDFPDDLDDEDCASLAAMIWSYAEERFRICTCDEGVSTADSPETWPQPVVSEVERQLTLLIWHGRGWLDEIDAADIPFIKAKVQSAMEITCALGDFVSMNQTNSLN